MSTSVPKHPAVPAQLPDEPALARDHRVAVVAASLFIAASAVGLGGPPPGRAATWALASIVVGVLCAPSWLQRSRRWPWIQHGVACAAVTASGGLSSPFLLALTVAPVGAALEGRHARLRMLTGAAVLLVAGHLLAGVQPPRAEALTAAMLTLALPWLPLLLEARWKRGQSPLAAGQRWRLTADDIALLRRLAAGGTYERIAEESSVSVETIKVRVARAYRRLGASNRAEAVAVAREWIDGIR